MLRKIDSRELNVPVGKKSPLHYGNVTFNMPDFDTVDFETVIQPLLLR